MASEADPIVTRNLPHEIPVALEIGIAEIDSQHRQLQALLDRLRQSTDKRYGFAADAILAELLVQTRIHFAVEESLMRLLSFPDAEAHVEEHRNADGTARETQEAGAGLRGGRRPDDISSRPGWSTTSTISTANSSGISSPRASIPTLSPVTRKPPA
jgi:hemerythrin-like metal-binding protein